MLSSVRTRSVAMIAALAAAALTQATPAFAAVRPPAGAHAGAHAASAPHAPAAAVSGRSHRTAVPRLKTKPAPGFGLAKRPIAWDARRVPASSSAATLRARRAGAARTALASSTVPDTCSGSIQPGVVYPCTTPSGSGTDTFTLTLKKSTDLLLIRVLSASGNSLGFTVTAPDSGTVSCQQPSYSQLPQCPTSQAGTYTLQVQNDGGSYTLSYLALLSASCAAANPSFATPTLTKALTAGGVGTCYALAMTAGQILHVNSSYNEDLLVTVYDSAGAQVCVDDQGDCTLTGTGPYVVLAYAVSADAITYYLDLNDITDPQGCIATASQAYGTVPSTAAGRCHSLSVSVAGQYQVYGVSPQAGLPPSTVYNSDGTVACTNTYSSVGPDCQLAAGSYDLVIDEYPQYPTQLGAVFIAADQSQGCQATGDSDFSSGPVTGTFTGIGEEICLTLPSAAGPALYLFNEATGGQYSAQLEVIDATGAQMCQGSSYLFTNCALTGTKPYRIIASGQVAGGGYRVLAQSSASTQGCAAWPQSGFGGSWGATVKLTATTETACLTIPARQHSTGEMIDYSNPANVVDAAINVFDPSGNNICTGASTAICAYKSGVAYTALLINDTGKPDTYHLVRRDVSSTAQCSAPTSTVAGGPSTTLALTSDLDSRCLRVTGPAADKFTFDVRATAPNSAGAVLQVTNASGSVVCNQFAGICQATGSTSYQLIVTALNYQGIAITAHVDAWLVATASGWASSCAAHSLSGSTGWAPIKVAMSESVTGYCAVLTVGANQDVEIYNPESTGTGVDQPYMMVEPGTTWTQFSQNLCAEGPPFEACELDAETAPGQYILLAYPGALPMPVDYTFQGVCRIGCSGSPAIPDITSVSPAKGPAGSISKLVVHGTNLNLGVQVDLAKDASNVASSTPVSLSADGTALTVLLDTQGVTPGTYDVVQNGVGYTVGTPSPGYLPDAYRVTAGPAAPPVGTFVPTGPARVLDTRTGLGGRKDALHADGTVSVKVAGVAGVPAKDVSAVMVNVTALTPARAGTLVGYPDGTSRPKVADVSFSAGQAASAQAVIPVTDGKIDLYNNSGGTVGLAVAMSGYFTSTGKHGRLTTIGSVPILDTRTGLHAGQAPLGAGKTLRLTVDGAGGVPKSGVSAVEVSVTALAPAKAGWLTAFADGSSRPAVSQLRFSAGQTTAGLITVPVTDGKIDLYNGSAGSVGLLADVVGYFSGGGAPFQARGPVRALDTRSGLGGAGVSVLAQSAADLSLNELPGWQGTQQAVVLSVTVLGSQHAGSLYVFADGQAIPVDPNLVFGAGKQVTVQVVVPITGPSVDFYNDSPGTVQILADVQGYGVAS